MSRHQRGTRPRDFTRPPTEAWCGCGHRMAGWSWQILDAAVAHWRVCDEPWRLLTDPPILLADKTEMGTR